MMGRTKNFIVAVAPHRLFTPRGFVWTAVAVGLLYAVCDALGWREYTAFLSGSAPAGERADLCLVLGIVYAVAHFGFLLGSPTLLLASGIFVLLLHTRDVARPASKSAGD
ncbi:MAG: hypothetical protein ABSG53_10725 [Thermoguttaceae bacterium]|jgi:hypothetical protein